MIIRYYKKGEEPEINRLGELLHQDYKLNIDEFQGPNDIK